MESIKGRFECKYESSASASYLVLTAAAEEKVESFQVEMIANNPSEGILPLDVRQINDSLHFYYNITSKQNLTRFLKRKKLMRNEFLGIIKNIVTVVLDSRNYLLYDRNFLINEDYIFINPYSLETSMIYMPVNSKSDIFADLRSFLMKLIIQTVNFDEGDSDNYLQRIINYVKQDICDLNGLKRLLVELECKNAAEISHIQEYCIKNKKSDNDNPGSEKTHEMKAAACNILNFEKRERKASERRKGSIPIPAKAKERGVQKPASPAKSPKTDDIVAGSDKAYRPASVIIAVLSQILIIGLIAVSWNSLKAIGDDSVTTCIGVCIAVLGAEYFLFKSLFPKNKSIQRTKKEERKNDILPEAATKNNTNTETRGFSIIPGMKAAEHSQDKVPPDKQIYTQLDSVIKNNLNNGNERVFQPMTAGNRIDETTFLGSSNTKKNPFLRGKNGNQTEDIPVAKASFIIGRIKEQVDLVSSNNAIGKIHAEIITRGKNYYIRDLNSRNGTFVNDVRLDSNKEFELSNLDKLTFANSSYTFVIPE